MLAASIARAHAVDAALPEGGVKARIKMWQKAQQAITELEAAKTARPTARVTRSSVIDAAATARLHALIMTNARASPRLLNGVAASTTPSMGTPAGASPVAPTPPPAANKPLATPGTQAPPTVVAKRIAERGLAAAEMAEAKGQMSPREVAFLKAAALEQAASAYSARGGGTARGGGAEKAVAAEKSTRRRTPLGKIDSNVNVQDEIVGLFSGRKPVNKGPSPATKPLSKRGGGAAANLAMTARALDYWDMRMEQLQSKAIKRGIKVPGKSWKECCGPIGSRANIIAALRKHDEVHGLATDRSHDGSNSSRSEAESASSPNLILTVAQPLPPVVVAKEEASPLLSERGVPVGLVQHVSTPIVNADAAATKPIKAVTFNTPSSALEEARTMQFVFSPLDTSSSPKEEGEGEEASSFPLKSPPSNTAKSKKHTYKAFTATMPNQQPQLSRAAAIKQNRARPAAVPQLSLSGLHALVSEQAGAAARARAAAGPSTPAKTTSMMDPTDGGNMMAIALSPRAATTMSVSEWEAKKTTTSYRDVSKNKEGVVECAWAQSTPIQPTPILAKPALPPAPLQAILQFDATAGHGTPAKPAVLAAAPPPATPQPHLTGGGKATPRSRLRKRENLALTREKKSIGAKRGPNATPFPRAVEEKAKTPNAGAPATGSVKLQTPWLDDTFWKAGGNEEEETPDAPPGTEKLQLPQSAGEGGVRMQLLQLAEHLIDNTPGEENNRNSKKRSASKQGAAAVNDEVKAALAFLDSPKEPQEEEEVTTARGGRARAVARRLSQSTQQAVSRTAVGGKRLISKSRKLLKASTVKLASYRPRGTKGQTPRGGNESHRTGSVSLLDRVLFAAEANEGFDTPRELADTPRLCV